MHAKAEQSYQVEFVCIKCASIERSFRFQFSVGFQFQFSLFPIALIDQLITT